MSKGNIFKIWDKEKQKYYSTGKKSMWKSYGWAAGNLNDLRQEPERYEIHELETTVVATTPGKQVCDEYNERRRIQIEAINRRDAIRREVQNLIPGGGFGNIYSQ
jgi:hypothetical protein